MMNMFAATLLISLSNEARDLAYLRCCLTNRWSGRVVDKVPSPNVGARAAQLNR
jgi:hypothetical protein